MTTYTFKPDPASSHHQIANKIPKSVKTILDIGCAGGFLAQAITLPSVKLTGVDIDQKWESSPYLKCYSKLFWRDINKLSWKKNLATNYDAIIMADILEHIHQPATVIRQASNLLHPKGRLLICLPNTNYIPFRILHAIFPGFRMNKGPLDRTHLHFFTPQTSAQLILRSKLKLVSIQYTPPPIWKLRSLYFIHVYLSNKIPKHFAYQYIYELRHH